MDALVKRRSIIKGQITKLTTYANACNDNTPYDDMKARLDKLLEHYRDFVEIESEIFSIDAKANSDIFAVDDNYYSCVASLQKHMRTKIQAPPNQANANESLLNHSHTSLSSDFKLPRLSLPIFTGKGREWQSFHDLFKSTVHDNINLSPAQKFQYLMGQLRGPAEQLVRYFRVDDASYVEAFQKLCKRYDRKRSIVNEFIDAFISQPVITKPSAETIGKMYDTCDEVIRGLKALGTGAETRDCWLIYLSEKKLDETTLQLWRQESSEKDFPTLDEFLEFMRKRMNSLEGTKPQIAKPATKSLASPKSFHIEPKALPICTLCTGQNHRLCDCPKFSQMDLEQRKSIITKHLKCFNCLADGHTVFKCLSRKRCHTCHKKHHTLLHDDAISPAVSNNPKPSTSANATTVLTTPTNPVDSNIIQNFHTTKSTENVDAILPTAIIEIQDKFGNWQQCRALLDSASTRSYITENCAQRLKIPRSNARFNINTLNGGRAGSSKGVVTLLMRSRINQHFQIDITTYILPRITSTLPPYVINTDKFLHLAGFSLADPNFHHPAAIDILIGCDRFLLLLSEGQKIESVGQPTALKTKLGWIIGGIHHTDGVNQKPTCLSTQADLNIDRTLRKFWEIEELPPVEEFTHEEKLCIRNFDKNLKIEGSGKFKVTLPFRPNSPALGDSLTQAVKRFRSIEQKLLKNPELRMQYATFLDEYEDLGHMELIPKNQINLPDDKRYYLPHHPVIKDSSSTTKLRVVFDASAKSTTGVSLNDKLMVGPTTQQTLLEILIRFRKHRYIFTADVEKMFRQVLIHKPDTEFQRIVWRKSPDEEIKHYRLLTVTYGTASASFLATRALAKVAEKYSADYPDSAKIILRDFYMDDLMSGAQTLEKAKKLQIEIQSLLQQSGFHLRKWSANNIELLENVPNEDCEVTPREITEGTKLISVLGIKFNPLNDSFSFKVLLPETNHSTKRIMLSEASRVFDPLGWPAPVTVAIKIAFQNLWLLKLQWDDGLPADTKKKWLDIRGELQLLRELEIPRWLFIDSQLQLCGFADASEDAYAAVIYARTVDQNGEIFTNLIAAKTRVAPLKTITIPKLELCAAQLLVRLLKVVIQSLDLEIPPNISLWSDSTTVLDWLSHPPRKGNIFVANRATEILNFTNVQQWSYIPSAQNPADCASRGILPSEIIGFNLWWQGPEWLRKEPLITPPAPKKVKKSKPVTLANSTESSRDEKTRSSKPSKLITKIVDESSCFVKAKRQLAWVLRSCSNFRNYKNRKIGPLSVAELNGSYTAIVKNYQKLTFSNEINTLLKNQPIKKISKISFLNPFLDNSGILRVGGRLQHTNELFDVKHPIILDGKSRLSHVLVENTHVNNLHAGPNLLMSLLKQNYTILRCKNLVRSVTHSCIKCFRQKRLHLEQLMGQLPPSRVNLIRAFLQVSVDYAGPFVLKTRKARSPTTYKAYLAVFTCMATKAVHLELASDMTTDTFLAAFRRFQGRRGVCTDVYSDNGTNFVGAANEIKYFKEVLMSQEASQQLVNWAANNNTNWHFVPPAAPNFNGLCEAAVKSVKYHLKRVLGDSILIYEEFYTLLTQIEALLNSRPICDSLENHIEALTPGHFIIGQPITILPEPDLRHLKVNRMSRWQLTQQLFQHFAKRWQTEYLTSLNRLSKWRLKTENIKEGDLVLIRDDNIPPGQWALGRVEETHPGKDDIVRVATVKTTRGVLKRPISKICLVPTIDSPATSTGATCSDSDQQTYFGELFIDTSCSRYS